VLFSGMLSLNISNSTCRIPKLRFQVKLMSFAYNRTSPRRCSIGWIFFFLQFESTIRIYILWANVVIITMPWCGVVQRRIPGIFHSLDELFGVQWIRHWMSLRTSPRIVSKRKPLSVPRSEPCRPVRNHQGKNEVNSNINVEYRLI
jgi:hypothetical protein